MAECRKRRKTWTDNIRKRWEEREDKRRRSRNSNMTKNDIKAKEKKKGENEDKKKKEGGDISTNNNFRNISFSYFSRSLIFFFVFFFSVIFGNSKFFFFFLKSTTPLLFYLRNHHHHHHHHSSSSFLSSSFLLSSFSSFSSSVSAFSFPSSSFSCMTVSSSSFFLSSTTTTTSSSQHIHFSSSSSFLSSSLSSLFSSFSSFRNHPVRIFRSGGGRATPPIFPPSFFDIKTHRNYMKRDDKKDSKVSRLTDKKVKKTENRKEQKTSATSKPLTGRAKTFSSKTTSTSTWKRKGNKLTNEKDKDDKEEDVFFPTFPPSTDLFLPPRPPPPPLESWEIRKEESNITDHKLNTSKGVIDLSNVPRRTLLPYYAPLKSRGSLLPFDPLASPPPRPPPLPPLPPPPPIPTLPRQRPFSRGTRKSAQAFARVIPGGTGVLTINNRDGEKYLNGNVWWIYFCWKPLRVLEVEYEYDIQAFAKGGGLGGQAGAIQTAVAREMIVLKPETREKLKREGLLTVDSRRVERKKFGKKKARKSPQYSKR